LIFVVETKSLIFYHPWLGRLSGKARADPQPKAGQQMGREKRVNQTGHQDEPIAQLSFVSNYVGEDKVKGKLKISVVHNPKQFQCIRPRHLKSKNGRESGYEVAPERLGLNTIVEYVG